MHLLDLIMYFILLSLVWKILKVISNGDYTEELGGATIGLFTVFCYTVIYTMAFVYFDYNWVDIFSTIYTSINTLDLRLIW